jgi:hypothetical protein
MVFGKASEGGETVKLPAREAAFAAMDRFTQELLAGKKCEIEIRPFSEAPDLAAFIRRGARSASRRRARQARASPDLTPSR